MAAEKLLNYILKYIQKKPFLNRNNISQYYFFINIALVRIIDQN